MAAERVQYPNAQSDIVSSQNTIPILTEYFVRGLSLFSRNFIHARCIPSCNLVNVRDLLCNVEPDDDV